MLLNLSWQKEPHIGYRVVGESLVLYRQASEQVWIFNSSASEVWELLATEESFTGLCQEIARRNQCPVEMVVQPVADFLTLLSHCNILHLYKDGQIVEKQNISKNMQKEFDILYSTDNRIQEALIETTYHCNLVCRHCYISEEPAGLSLAQLEQIFTELKELGCVDLRLSGGEIFLRDDLFAILDRAVELGFRITLMSNGILINDEIIEKLKAYPIKKIKVSLYSLQPEIHKMITKAPGSYEKTLTAILKLHQSGIKVVVNTMIQKENASGLSKLKEFAEEHGLGFQCDYKLFPRHDGDREPLAYYVEKDALVNLFQTGIISEFGEIRCAAGSTRLKINPYGDIYACEFLDYSVGNIVDNSLSEVWSGSRIQYIRKAVQEFAPLECSSCEYKAKCLRCPALVWHDGKFPNIHHELMCYHTECYHQALAEGGNYRVG